ncbi:hypothetical protein [Geodermatophilus sp. SYSU D00710]
MEPILIMVVRAPDPRRLRGAGRECWHRGDQDVIDSSYALALDNVVPHGHADLLLTISGIEEESALIERIEPVIFKSEETVPLWSLDGPRPGCGGFNERIATLSLMGDDSFLTDKGGRTELTAAPNQFGSYFTVSASDQTGISIIVGVCDSQYYDLGLDITFTLRVAEYHHLVGSAEDPYKIVGGGASEYFFTIQSPGPEQVTQVEKPEEPPITLGMC